jgi:hypothetical protein
MFKIEFTQDNARVIQLVGSFGVEGFVEATVLDELHNLNITKIQLSENKIKAFDCKAFAVYNSGRVVIKDYYKGEDISYNFVRECKEVVIEQIQDVVKLSFRDNENQYYRAEYDGSFGTFYFRVIK